MMRDVRVEFEKEYNAPRGLGVAGEHMATRLVIDCEKVLSAGELVKISILVRRADKASYMAATGIDPDAEGMAYYVLTNLDTAISGHVYVQVMAVVGETVIKSFALVGYLAESLSVPQEDPPPPIPDWANDIAVLLQGIINYGDVLEAAARGANQAKADADAAAARANAATENANAAEQLRQNVEQERAAADRQRVDAEGGRVTAEETRRTAETGRVEAENQRITKEAERQTAEAQRAQIEQERQTAEGKRQTDTAAAIARTNEAAIAAEGVMDDVRAAVLDVAAGSIASYADTNPAVIVPAAGSHITVTADRDCTLWQYGDNAFGTEGWYNWLRSHTTQWVQRVDIDGIDSIYYRPDSTYDKPWMLGFFKPQTKYTISCRAKGIPGDGTSTGFKFRYEDGTSEAFYVNPIAEWKYYYVTSNGKSIKQIEMAWNYGQGAYFDAHSIMLVEGATAKEYMPYKGGGSYSLSANAPTVISSISGTNCLYADSSAQLTIPYNRDSMDFARENLIQVSDTAPAARIDGCVSGLPLDVTMRCVATQTGTGDPSPNNIRPIVGRTTSNISHAGVNLFRQGTYSGGSNAGKITALPNGYSLTGSSSWISGYEYIPGLPPGTYTLSVYFEQKDALTTVSLDARQYGGSSPTYATVFSSAASGRLVLTFTIPPDKTGFTMYMYSNASANVLNSKCDYTNYVLEKGSSVSAYAPFVSRIYPIAFGDTVFGLAGAQDEVSVTSGLIIKRTKRVALTGQETYSVTPNSGVGVFGVYLTMLGGKGNPTDICTRLKWSTTFLTSPGVFVVHTNGNLYMSFDANVYGTLAAVKDAIAQAYAAEQPYEFVYAVTTPTTQYIAAPITIPSYPGTNTAWSDGGGDTTIAGWQRLAGYKASTDARLTAMETYMAQHP